MRTKSKSPYLIKKLLSDAVGFYALSGLTSAVNYLFYPTIAHYLSTQEYGEMQFLVSMFGQLAIGFVVLNILAVVISAKLSSTERTNALSFLNTSASIAVSTIAILGISMILFFQNTLGITSTSGIILLGFALIANVPYTVLIGRLQGEGRFVSSGLAGFLSVLAKLIISTTLVAVGLGVGGAVAGIVVSLILAWAIGAVLTRDSLGSQHRNRLNQTTIKVIKDYAITTLVVIGSITLLSTMDTIISRISLDGNSAGQYAAVATITKIILAIATPLMWLALPKAINKQYKYIVKLALLALAGGALATILFTSFPALFTKILLGIDTGEFSRLIPLASVAMTLFGVAYITSVASICEGDRRKPIVASISSLLTYGIVLLLGSLFTPLLDASLIAQVSAAIVFIASTYVMDKKHNLVKSS